MPQRKIKRTEWPQFCDQFTRKHQGWLVAVKEIDTSAADSNGQSEHATRMRNVVFGVPLQTLAVVPNPHGASLLLQVGDEDQTLRVLIRQPEQMLLQYTEDGLDNELWIDGADNRTTCVAFRAADAIGISGVQATSASEPAETTGHGSMHATAQR
jgi:hypothetical protein